MKKFINMQEPQSNSTYEGAKQTRKEFNANIIDEIVALSQRLEKQLKDIKNDPTRKIVLKEIQAEKEKAEFDKFYEEHCKKYGNTL